MKYFKKLLFCSMLMLAFVACNKEDKTEFKQSEPTQYSREDYGYKGDVKSSYEESYGLNYQTGEIQVIGSTSLEFNKQGFLSDFKYSSADGLYVYQSKFAYNDRNECITRKDDNLIDGEKSHIDEISEYDKNGNCISIIRQYDGISRYTYNKYKGNNLVSTEVYEVNENGDKILEEKSTYEYSKSGFNTKIVAEYYENGVPVNTDVTENEYDDKGNVICMKFLDLNNNLLSSCKYKYNENDREIECAVFNSDGELESKLEYVYNEEDCCVENRSYYKDTLNSSTLFKYDEHKNILECVRIDYEMATKETDYYEYVYDEHDNIIEYYSYDSNRNLITSYKRTITYY